MPVSLERAVRFIGDLSNTKGKFAGSPFTVHDFQRDVLAEILQVDASGHRTLNEFLLGVARKNGKTELIAALALVFLVLDDEPGGEVAVAAGKRDQARILFNAAGKMVKTSRTSSGKPFTDFLVVRRDHIYFPELDAKLYPVSADAQNEQGLNPHVAIVDELHVAAQSNRDLYDALQTAQGARENPLLLSMTTAGPMPTGPCYDLYKYGMEIASGVRSDSNFGMRWWQAPNDCAIDDPEAWALANPALDKFLYRSFLEKAAQAVLDGRRPEYTFRRLHLNNWTTAVERWLPFARWEACGKDPVIFPEGCPVYIGIDSALRRDTFGVALVHVTEETREGWRENAEGLAVPVSETVKVANVRVRRFVPAREGDYIDPAEVETYLLGIAAQHPILDVSYDPNYMGLLASALADRGMPMEPFPQTADRMGKATETWQRAVLDERIRHGNDPVLNSQMAATGTKTSGERGVRISKQKSGMAIDCVTAAAMAVDRAIGEDQADDFAFFVE